MKKEEIRCEYCHGFGKIIIPAHIHKWEVVGRDWPDDIFECYICRKRGYVNKNNKICPCIRNEE